MIIRKIPKRRPKAPLTDRANTAIGAAELQRVAFGRAYFIIPAARGRLGAELEISLSVEELRTMVEAVARAEPRHE